MSACIVVRPFCTGHVVGTDGSGLHILHSTGHGGPRIAHWLPCAGNTTGYVAMGISDISGRMGPADVVFGWVENGTAALSDRQTLSWNVSRALQRMPAAPVTAPLPLFHHPSPKGGMWPMPIPLTAPDCLAAADPSQDYVLVDGSIVDGRTSITFRRLLDTGDVDDRPIVPGSLNITWCAGGGFQKLLSAVASSCPAASIPPPSSALWALPLAYPIPEIHLPPFFFTFFCF
jgi:hypothetical protein